LATLGTKAEMMAHYALYAHPIGGRLRILQESPIELEERLQEVLKENPDLIPATDLGLEPPLLVVGRESVLASGYADLVCIDRSGMLVIVEVKRGKEGDARRAIAQALDYGSDIWHEMREAVRGGREATSAFEQAVAIPYFSGPRYPDKDRPQSLREAAKGVWESMAESAGTEWWEDFQQNLESTLISGKYSYIVFAPSIPENVRTTIEYLSATANFSFAAVEVDHFADKAEGFEVYAPHAIAVPPPPPPPGPRRTVHIRREQWLDTLLSEGARSFFEALTADLEAVAGVELVYTEAGYFGIGLTRQWGGRPFKAWLSDSYSAGSGRALFGRDVLRLGYSWGTPEPLSRALDPWIDRLLKDFGGQDMRATQSRYARWDVPDSRLNAKEIAEAITETVQIVMGVPEPD
jgi:hypothetical protein